MIIGLVGKAGAGKDTVFEIIHSLWENKYIVNNSKRIEKIYHQEFQNVKFAGKLKEICALLTGYPVETFYDRNKYNWIIPDMNISLRELMQRVGDGLRQTVDNQVWINAALAKVTNNSNVVITDCRYPNELEAIHSKGGIIIRVTRPNHQESTIVGEQANHSSETALNDIAPEQYNYDIINNGTLDELRIKVKLIMEELWNQEIKD